MEKNETYTETYTWSNLVGQPAWRDDLDYDDCCGRDGYDWRRADRDGWGSQMVWDGR